MAKPMTNADLQQQILELRKQIEDLAAQPKPVAKKNGKGQPREDVYYVLLGIPTKGMPPQAIACARILATAVDATHIPEKEAMQLIVDAAVAGRLKTSQDPWHIFQYYRPRLIESDFLKMLNA